jgi:hypothetical protein
LPPTPEPTEDVGSATPEPTDDVGPTSSEEPVPTVPSDPAPLIVAKVDNKGTRQYSDDTLLAGAHFRIYRDDGDGRYEADEDTVAFDGVAEHGFLVFERPQPGEYWVVEIDAPSGFELARPKIVRYRGDEGEPANCVAAPGAQLRCEAAIEGRPGFVMLVVPNRPAGLPPTDVARKRR